MTRPSLAAMGGLRRVAAAVCLAVLAGAGPGRADTGIIDIWENGTVGPGLVFPNWKFVRAASWDVLLCNGCAGATETLTGVTIVNFGNATTADISAVYFNVACTAGTSPLYTMTYAGPYVEDSGSLPAWTWGGATINLATCGDYCGGTCGGYFTLTVYADVAPCPTELRSIWLGLPYHSFSGAAAWWGSIADNIGWFLPWGDLNGERQTIVYARKVGPDTAAPGDSASFTITYGRPGATPLTNVVITDTLPPFTHYVVGTGVPAPDPGFDPDWGPPVRLRWTLPGGPTTGGPTAEVRFALSVDWGNGESFEPGSGDVAAPEQARLDNRAHVAFPGTSCPASSIVTQPVTTVVRRFLFWKLGDNDLLFSPSPGQPPDEMTYSIFIKNESVTRTWWDVHVWDTVPAELDPWCAGCGFDDPCSGWTMTPSGCAAASPGRIAAGGATLLTWRLDLPPAATLTLRWKSQVKPSTTAGATTINRAAVLAWGRAGIVAGTGHSGTPRTFTHAAQIVLPTTYISYVGFAGSFTNTGCPGFLISFFPLNRKAQFELRGLQYLAGGWAAAGGASAPIGCLIGDCVGGFPGSGGCALASGAIPGGGIPGCKAERIPARYEPPSWTGTCPSFPFNFVYKMTANAPVVWQLLTRISVDGDDSHTYAPASSLTYTGLMHYAFRRDGPTKAASWGDGLNLISTGADATGAYDPTRPTTVHLFQFNYGTLTWDYARTYELGGESQAYDMGTNAAQVGPWRTVSSDVQLIVDHGLNLSDTLSCCCGLCGNDFEAYLPTRETGNTVTPPGGGTHYGIVQSPLVGTVASRVSNNIVIGNTGLAPATYEIWRYAPDSQLAIVPMPLMLNGTSGTWQQVGSGVVPAGLATAGNPQMYDRNGPPFNAPSLALYKIRVAAGGAIQALGGVASYAIHSGGSVIHASDGNQTGQEFWLHYTGAPTGKTDCGGGPGFTATQTINVYVPRKDTAIRCVSEDGYSATYTTSLGPDQCVSFTALSDLAEGVDRNYRVNVLGGPSAGKVITQYIQCMYTQKGYTAPFVQTGTHYQLIVPAVAYAGQSFWLTIVVIEAGTTKADYCGTTSFTSTDPGALLEGTALDSYNFTWSTPSCPGGPDENGVRMFVNVTLGRLGTQTILASDTVDGSITGLAAILVVGADVKLSKTPRLQVAASGDTVQFRVCWSNFSSASAFTFVMTDAVPVGTAFVPEAGTGSFDCGNSDGLAPRTAYSIATSATPPAAFTDGNPPLGTHWLRWTIPVAGVNTTGCVCYRVSVN